VCPFIGKKIGMACTFKYQGADKSARCIYKHPAIKTLFKLKVCYNDFIELPLQSLLARYNPRIA